MPANIVRIAALASLILFSGCAAQPDPIVDMKGVDPDKFALDWQECEAYSEEIVIAKGAAKGAATGAAVGAVAGAIDGDAEEGAAYGGLYGATRSGLKADRDQQMVFKRCLRGRGYRVLN